MSDTANNFIEQFIPAAPTDEVSRDAVVRKITTNFSSNCQQQMITGPIQSGKTNLLSQFARFHNKKTISYFITNNPLSQLQHTFLYSLCCQLSIILKTNLPQETIELNQLKSLFTALCTNLYMLARKENCSYYFIIDGIEQAFSGVEGERIIDLLPIETKQHSPYLLLSCRSDIIKSLPLSFNILTTELMSFSIHETEAYFSDSDFSTKEIKNIHEKYNGIPGLLKIIKDTKRIYPNKDLIVPDNLNRLIDHQIDLTFANISSATKSALEYLAISPAPLSLNILTGLIEIEETSLTQELLKTRLIQLNIIHGSIEYINELSRENVKKKIGDQAKYLIEQLTVYVRDNYRDDFLLALLYKESQDYLGLKSQLSSNAILASTQANGDISHVVQRLRIASDMAQQQNDIQGLLKWTLGIAAAKSFVDHTVDQNEIWALLSIRESHTALRKIYAIPENSSKIRLLARAYTSMRENGEKISSAAKEELTSMVNTLSVDTIDKEIAHSIAVDLLPILPDTAISMLEKTIQQRKEQGIIELAIEELSTPNENEDRSGDFSNGIEGFTFLFPSLLRNRPFNKLLEELKPKTTKAKEYIIREWCKQNRKNPNIIQAINLWLDVVEDDHNFIIVLRSLRQISEIVMIVPVDKRMYLLNRLKVPKYTSINAPKEEWIRLRLNLAEGLYAIEPEIAWKEIIDIHTYINEGSLALDEQAFCLARLRLAIHRIKPSNIEILRKIERQFEKIFSSLLENSAEHYDTLHDTIETITNINPEDALIVASELNTRNRRIKAFHIVLESSLYYYNQKDISNIIRDALDLLGSLDESNRDLTLNRIVRNIRIRNISLCQKNIDTLLIYINEIRDSIIKSEALANLSVLYKNISLESSNILINQSVDEWRKEDNLSICLESGFNLVQIFSKVDMDYAKSFYSEVQKLQYQPGSGLALGDLGLAYTIVLDQVIRVLSIDQFSELNDTIRLIEQLIARIPARRTRIQMYGKLASSAYRSGFKPRGDEIVRTRVISEIRNMRNSRDRNACLVFCLPVIFAYDQEEAELLAKPLPTSSKNEAWHSVALSCISHNLLGDQINDARNIRIQSDRPKLQKAIQAITHITYDYLLLNAITAISTSIETSYEKEIDVTQALDLLVKLEEQAHDRNRLPDQENIKHEGYVILAESAIHRVKSNIYIKVSNKRDLSKRDIEASWISICQKSRLIPNIADRVFVLAIVARDLSNYYIHIKNKVFVKSLLDESYQLISNIPAMLDRLDRIEAIADTWRQIGEKEQSKFLLKFILESLNELQSVGFDQRLASITQLAYKISPDFADEIVSRFDTRHPAPSFSAHNIALEIEKLVGNPSKITDRKKYTLTSGAILSATAQHMLRDIISGKGTILSLQVLSNWLKSSQMYHQEVILNITEWIIESLYYKYHLHSTKELVDTLLDISNLIYQLSHWVSPSLRSGIPESIQNSFSALGTNFIVFQAGESERAQRWLNQWLSENAHKYLKICDPYFSIEQIEYFRNIPIDCKIIVITTDKKLDLSRGPDALKEDIVLYWNKISSQSIPITQFLIVPKDTDNAFHDRAIITFNKGIDLGQSLNGLGKSQGKITILQEEEAKELENIYLNSMLNQATWFMEHGVNPTVFIVGGNL